MCIEEKLDKLQELDKKRIVSLVYSEKSSDFSVEKLESLTSGIGADFVGKIETAIPITYGEIMINEIDIRGCFMFPFDSFQQLIRMVQSGLLDMSKIVTRTTENAAKKTSDHFIDIDN